MVLHIITVWCVIQERDEFKESDMVRSCSTHARMTNVYKYLDRRPERMRTLGKYLCRWMSLCYELNTCKIEVCREQLLWGRCNENQLE
jgi:hypothetical protein